MMATFSIIQKSQLEGADRIDAEYFMPDFLNISSKLDAIPSVSLDLLSEVTASAFYPAATEFYGNGDGIPFIRGVDIIEYPIMNSAQSYERLPEDFLKNYKNIKRLKNGDIVVSKVGTPCFSSLLNEDLKDVALSRTVLGLTNIKNVNTFYLLAFLRSRYGFNQLRREVELQVQEQLTLERVRRIKIYTPTVGKQEEIASIVKDFFKLGQNGKSYYKQAQNLLLQELGLLDFKPKEDLSYVVNYSDTKKNNRVDADYFQPKYQIISEKIKINNAKTLGELVILKKGFEPGSETYKEEGKLFIRVSSLSKFGIESKDQKYLSNELYQKLKSNYEPKIGEILLTKDATPGISYVVKEPIEGIISGGILRLKLKVDIDVEYLSLCISSLIGQMQAERDAGGSIIVHWKPEQIKNILIPILPKETQQKIADLVRKSHEARKKSKDLLEEAKRKVEEMIEKSSE